MSLNIFLICFLPLKNHPVFLFLVAIILSFVWWVFFSCFYLLYICELNSSAPDTELWPQCDSALIHASATCCEGDGPGKRNGADCLVPFVLYLVPSAFGKSATLCCRTATFLRRSWEARREGVPPSCPKALQSVQLRSLEEHFNFSLLVQALARGDFEKHSVCFLSKLRVTVVCCFFFFFYLMQPCYPTGVVQRGPGDRNPHTCHSRGWESQTQSRTH